MTEIIVNCDLKFFNSVDELCYYFAEVLKNDVSASKEKFNLALSGGSTPKQLYNYLSEFYKDKIDWEKINFFWGDERCVTPTDDESNYKTAYDTLLSKISLPQKNIFRIKGESDPSTEAERYSEIIKSNVPNVNSIPKFDMILLGLGEDGHTASIFPDQIELIKDRRISVPAIHPVTFQNRITLTGTVINNSRTVIFIVTGQSKREIVSDIIKRKSVPKNIRLNTLIL